MGVHPTGSIIKLNFVENPYSIGYLMEILAKWYMERAAVI